jgi:hypothetical protein
MAINEMYGQGKIKGDEYEELQKCLYALYKFNKQMDNFHYGEYISDNHIEISR